MFEEAKKVKLWKLRLWTKMAYLLKECHAVDKIMVLFTGKSQLRIYMPAKPYKWGYKMWGCAGQSGFLDDFDICQGAENPDQANSDVGATGKIVLKIASTLPGGKN